MATGLVKLIKQAALEAVENSSPATVRTGVVTAVDPVTIQITNNLPLREDTGALVIPREFTDYELEVEISEPWQTSIEPSHVVGEGTVPEHSHTVSGMQKIVVKNALKVGEECLLVREQGGQAFVVFGRIKGGSENADAQ